MPHHTRAPSGSPVFRIAAAGELRGEARFWFSWCRSRDARWGLEQVGGWGLFFYGGVLFKLGMSLSKDNQPQSTQRAQSDAAFLSSRAHSPPFVEVITPRLL
ncbi:MAG: hypothetical protein KKG76_04130 [Euryarchaeota archaeon]|nr:hypothetical protein [Euryarchaeota archaeon]